MTLTSKIAYNTAIQFASKIISTFLGLAAIAYMTRYLGQNGFGEYTTAVTFISFFAVLADLGLTLVTVQMISKPGTDQNEALSNLFGLRFFSALLFIGIGPIIALFFPYSAEIKMAIFIAAFSFFFPALNQVLVGLFQKHLRMSYVSIAEIVGRLALIAGVFIAMGLDYGLNGIMVASVAASLANFFILYVFSTKISSIRIKFNPVFWKEIICKSWPLAVTIFFNLIYLKADTLLLSLIKRPSEIGIIAEVGLYGAAYRVIDVLVTLPFMFSGIVLPILTLRWANQDKPGFNKAMQRSFDALALLALPLAVGTHFVATDTMNLVAGKEFTASGPILEILIFAASIIFLGNIFSHAVIAIDKQRKIIKAYIFVAITSLLGYLIFIPIYSYFGAAWVTIYSETAIALASAYLVWKHTRFLPSLRIFFGSAAAAGIMGAGIFLLNGQNLLFKISAAIAIYALSLFALRVITKKDLVELIPFK